MPLDPRISLFAGQGVTPIDPMAFQRGQQTALQLQAAQRQGQLQQMELAEAQRQEQERGTLARAFRGALVTDPATGATRVDMPRAFTEAYRTTSDPLTVFKAQQSYEKSQAASAKDVLESRKTQLETAQQRNDYVSNLARGLLAVEDQGGNVQAAYEATLAQAAQDLGVAKIPGMPPTYDRSVMNQLLAQGKAYDEKLKADHKLVDQQMEKQRLDLQRQQEERLRRGEGREEKRLGLEEQRLDVQTQELEEKRRERLQTREGQQQQRLGEREEGLRKEFNDLTKNYRVVADSYGRIQSAQETGPGDISMIFSYMKLLDPGSTVREGEFATAQNAGGVPERIIGQYNRLVSGERLAPETRKQFLDQAEMLYQQATRDYDRTRKHYEGLAQSYGADPAKVTQEMGSTATPKSGSTGKASGTSGGAKSPHGHIPLDQMTPQQLEEEEAWWEAQQKKGR